MQGGRVGGGSFLPLSGFRSFDFLISCLSVIFFLLNLCYLFFFLFLLLSFFLTSLLPFSLFYFLFSCVPPLFLTHLCLRTSPFSLHLLVGMRRKARYLPSNAFSWLFV